MSVGAYSFKQSRDRYAPHAESVNNKQVYSDWSIIQLVG